MANKKEIWKIVIQTLISILTSIGAALEVVSCAFFSANNFLSGIFVGEKTYLCGKIDFTWRKKKKSSEKKC